jgi:hypothetical protein
MLKTVSSITNAIGALNYKGTWDANANSPALASSVGTKGDYYVVGTAGSTNLNGITNWGIGDWAAFNGSVWQRVEGGANLNGVDLSVSGTSTLSGLTASTSLALNASKEIISVTNTGTGNNVLATTPTLVGDVTLSTGNLIIGTSGKGIDFSITSHPAGMTSELLSDYEEGTFTPDLRFGGAKVGMAGTFTGNYTKIGRAVNVQVRIALSAKGSSTGVATIEGLPFTSSTYPAAIIDPSNTWVLTGAAFVGLASTTLYLLQQTTTGRTTLSDTNLSNDSDMRLEVTYIV